MASQPDQTLDKEALLQQLGSQPDPNAAAMNQDAQGNWSLQEHGNTRALQGQEVDDAKKYVSDLAAQRQPAEPAPMDQAQIGQAVGLAGAALGGMGGGAPAAPRPAMNPLDALKPSNVLNPLSAQNPLAPKNVGNLLNPMSATNPLAPKNVLHQLDPRTVHQNVKNVLNPRNILHPKEAFRRIFGGG